MQKQRHVDKLVISTFVYSIWQLININYAYPQLANTDACVWDGKVATTSDTQRGYAPRIEREKQASLGFAWNNSWLPRQKKGHAKWIQF